MSDPSEDVWTCKNCTLVNEQMFDTCQVCDCPKPAPEDLLTPRKLLDKAHIFFAGIPDQLSSAVNSVQNLVSSSPEASPPRTSSTLHSKPTTSSPQQTQNDDVSTVAEWICSRCTYLNGEGAKHCNICGAPERFKIQSSQLEDSDSSSNNDLITISDEDKEPMEIFCESCGFSYTTDVYKHCPICSFDDEVVEIPSTSSTESVPFQNHTAITTPVKSSKSTISNVKMPPPVKPRSSGWTCSKCTFENKNNEKKCDVCKSKKEGETCKKEGEKWTCRHCSYRNDATSLSCYVCKIKQSGENEAEEAMRYSVEKEKSITMEWRRQQDAKDAKDKFERIRTFCRENSLPFVDDSFPPAPRSLFGNTSPGTQLTGKVSRWLRPNELHEHKENPTTPWKVFRLPVLPTDISQGTLGDCWFLSALSVLAERPELVEQIMVTTEINREGAYQVRLCNDGCWQTILIDDSLPATHHGMLVCSKAKRKQLWVPLIEKALAKMNGSYESLIAGRCWEGLAILTGASCETVQLQATKENPIDASLIWATLLSSKEAGFLMGASCGGGNMKVDGELYESLGLRRRHSYSVLDVQDICDNRLLRLRNPWGRYSWNGDWSDNSSKWTRDLREALGAHEASGGVFWISLDDILKYFDTIDISKLHRGWSEVRVEGVFPTSASQPCKVTVLTLDRPTEVDFTLYQTWRKSQTTTSTPSDLMIIVLRAQGDQVVGEPKVVAFGRRQLRAFISCSAMLEAGDYIVMCCSFNHLKPNQQSTDTHHPYILAMHSSRPVVYSSAMKSSSLVSRAVIALAVQEGNRHEGREGVTCYYLSKGWSGAIIVVENRYPDSHLHIQCDCKGSFNVVSSRETLFVTDSIPPLHSQIVIILSQCVETGYSIRHHITNRMSHRPDLKDWGPKAQHVPELNPDVFALHSPQPL